MAQSHKSPFSFRLNIGTLASGSVLLTIIFLVLLPKGGISIGSLPLTWGYVFLGLSAGFAFIANCNSTAGIGRWFIALSLSCVFGFYAVLSQYLVGTPSAVGVIVIGTVTLLLPFIFLGLLGPWMDRTNNFSFMMSAIRWCVFLAAALGIILFFYYLFTKKVIEIPYLTSNGGSEEGILSKNNRRGELQKLVSTYNNGNIYGICTLMLLPLFCILEKRVWLQYIVKAAVFLTLSRSVWAALIVSELICLLFLPGNKLRQYLLTLALAVSVMACIGVILTLMNRDMNFIFDTDLGGRAVQLDFFEDITFFTKPVEGVREMVYVWAMYRFGVFGLLLLFVSFGAAMVAFFMGDRSNPIRRAAIIGCVNYWIICLADGAFIFIPVLAFYWFLNALLWCRNPYIDQFRTNSRKPSAPLRNNFPSRTRAWA